MKKPIAPKYLARSISYRSDQRKLLTPKPSKIKDAFVAIAQTTVQILHDLFIRDFDPFVSEHHDYNGSRYYQVYDPIHEETYRFASEDEVCIWLEQSYYR